MNNPCKRDSGCPFIMSIFNNVDMYGVLIDKSGEIICCTEKFKRYYKNEVVNKKLSELISSPAYEEIRKAILEVIFTNKQVQRDITFQDNSIYNITFYPFIDADNIQITYLMLTAENITTTKKLEEEIEELKMKLEESNSIKSIFLSNVSHELKTPMNSIIGFCNILSQEENKDKIQKFIKSINSNAKHLDELLTNILDFSRIESNEFDLLYENFSLNDLFEDLLLIFEDINQNKNLDFVKMEFIKREDKKIICDYLRLKQVLFNVISNAIKFTDKGYIKISYYESNGSIIFKVEDTGIGIPEDKINLIFDRFWQCDSSSRKKYKGTGLGLSISKSIVELLNGQIWVESILNKGTTIYITIPLEVAKKRKYSKKGKYY